MKSITIEKYHEEANKNNSDIMKNMFIKKFDHLKAYIDTIFIYVYTLEEENDNLKQDKARLYAENSALRKELNLKEKSKKEKEETDELDDIYTKLKELRSQKIKFEEELDKCISFIQDQYDDLK